MSVSLDGFVAGPDPTLERPLGEGGELLHEWAIGLESWRERHGLSGGEQSADSELVAETLASTGAVVMGRRMFSGGEGAWEDDPNADGWWGDDPPFRMPVFVVTHHARDTVAKERGTSFAFVTEGVEAAIEQAGAAARGRDVQVAGGARVGQQALRAGLIDELLLHLVPVLLGTGTRLFEAVRPADARLELDRSADSAAVTHLRYRVVR
jgi:dihydrofolate reductase